MTTSFTRPLRVEVLSKESRGRVQARLLEPFTYNTDGGALRITVPSGFVTDFASVPRIFWGIAPPLGRYGKAAVVHDFLCIHPRNLSRRKVDAIFYEAMRVLDVPIPLAWSMWTAVRIAAIVRLKK